MKDEWLRAAMSDDKMVAELLIRLRESDPHPSAFTRQAGVAVAALLASLPPFDWGTRQPRSKSAASAAGSASAGKKDRERTRRSPTTPLSWSACGVGSGASPSDGYEDSSRPSDRLFSAVRSKATATNETTTSTTGTKRPRRKKTFAELKEEESSLMKDKTHLKRELNRLRNKLEEERSLNEKLKRIKLDLHVPAANKPEQEEEEEEEEEEVKKNEREVEASTLSTAPWNSSVKLKQAKPEHASDCHDSSIEKASFVLPDLNMMPEEDGTFPGKTLARTRS